MPTPDRLTLTLERIEGFLAILSLDYFNGDVEVGQRVIDDLHFLHGELKAGRKTLPLPRGERRPLNVAFGREGYFSTPFTELHDRTVDLLDLFKTNTWPLLAWEAEKFVEPIPDEAELHSLYGRLVATLRERDLEELMKILGPGLESASCATGWDKGSLPDDFRYHVNIIMSDPDYKVEAPDIGDFRLYPMFDSRRLKLLHPHAERHALGIFPFSTPREIYEIQCEFGRINGHWMVVGSE